MFLRPSRGDAGFSVLETVVAAGVLAVGLASLAQLALMASRGAQAAAFLTTSAILAQDKLEQLRAAEWPESPDARCCEFFDADGTPLGEAASPPVGAVFVRRWSVEALPALAHAVRVLKVRVGPVRGAGEVVLVTARARRSG